MYIGLPRSTQRQAMIRLYRDIHIDKYFDRMYSTKWHHMLLFQYFHRKKSRKKLQIELEECFSSDFILQMSELLDGFSGREISKLFISINHAMLLLKGGCYHTKDTMISRDMILPIIQQKVLDHKQMLSFHRMKL
jgi:hypothetical protein